MLNTGAPIEKIKNEILKSVKNRMRLCEPVLTKLMENLSDDFSTSTEGQKVLSLLTSIQKILKLILKALTTIEKSRFVTCTVYRIKQFLHFRRRLT